MIQSQKDESIYTGIAIDPIKRLEAHNKGKGAKYTKTRGPFVMLWNMQCPNRSTASKLERAFKKFSHKEKLEFTRLNT